MTKRLELREESTGWGGESDNPTYFIDIDAHMAAIAVAAGTKEEAEQLAKDIVKGLTLLEETITIPLYKIQGE